MWLNKPVKIFGRNLLAWSLIPLLIVLALFDTQRNVLSVFPNVPLYNWIIVLLAGLMLPLIVLVHRLPKTRRNTATYLILFSLLILVALVSTFIHGQPSLTPTSESEPVSISRIFLVTPLIAAIFTMLVAWFYSYLSPYVKVENFLLVISWTILLTSYVGFLRLVLRDAPSQRMASGLGGAAVLHIPLLLATATFLGACIGQKKLLLNGLGALLSVTAVILTGSRAGEILLAALLISALIFLLHKHIRPRILFGFCAFITLCLGVMYVIAPQSFRVFQLHDFLRSTNTRTALAAVLGDPKALFVGLGHGQMWPWLPGELGKVEVIPSTPVASRWGPVLPSPHSLYLWAFVELGLIGLILLVTLCILIWHSIKKSLQSTPTIFLINIALALSTIAFAVDTYLVKNFPTSLIWWVFLFSVTRINSCKVPANNRLQ